MPDLDNDHPTPDFDDLIAQMRRLCEEGNYDKAIELAVSIALEVLINYEKFSSINEAVDTCKQIFDILNTIRPDVVVKSPGRAYAMLAICTSFFRENDPCHLDQISWSKANEYGWSEFHTKCYFQYLRASEENLEETLTTLREWAQENPAAWFYVGEFEGWKETCLEIARDAFLQVPEHDPNYVRAMLRAGEYWELLAEISSELYGFRYEAEDCYEKALEKSSRSQEVRLAYLHNHFRLLLEEAAENGFDRDRVEQASEFVGKIGRVLSGKPAETEQSRGTEGREDSGPASSRLLTEQDTIFGAQLLQGSERRIIDRISGSDQLLRDLMRQVSYLTAETQQTHEEIRAGSKSIQEGFSDLRERWETNVVALQEAIQERVIEQLQLTDEKLADCEQKLRTEHSEFWGSLTPASVRYLATGCYILDVLGRNAVRVEYSCAAIEFTKTLETELRQHLVDPFISFAMQQGRGPNIFEKERGKITVGDICYVLETSGLKSKFVESLGEKGCFLSTDFSVLKKINKLRGEAAHVGDIGRSQASDLRDMVLKILPKIVALRAC